MKSSIKDFFRTNPQEAADLATFTEEILNGKLHFLWSVREKMFKQGNSSNRQKMNGPFIASSKDFAADDCELTQIKVLFVEVSF